MNVNKRLSEINKELNIFAKSMKTKPFESKKDAARVAALITAIRRVLSGAVRNEIPKHKTYFDKEPVPVTDEQIERNLKGIEEARKNLKQRRNNDIE